MHDRQYAAKSKIVRTIYACFLRDTQTLLFRVSTLFTLEIGRHVCMVRESLASDFGCACFVRLQPTGEIWTFRYLVYDPRIDYSELSDDTKSPGY